MSSDVPISDDIAQITADVVDPLSTLLNAAETDGEGPSDEGLSFNAVRRFRAEQEPPLLPDHALEMLIDSPFYDAMLDARIEQTEVAPSGERIVVATWPEMSMFFSRASLRDASFARGMHADWYMYSFVASIERYFEHDVEELIPNNRILSVTLNDYERLELAKFRRALKDKRDEVFIEHKYDADAIASPKAAFRADEGSARKGEVPTESPLQLSAKPASEVVLGNTS